MTHLRIRKDLDAIPSYRQGKGAEASPERPVYKISSNENPYPPLPAVTAAVEQLLGSVNRYPDSAGTALSQALSERYDVPAANIVLGSGSIEIVAQLMRAVTDPGDEIIFAWRSFEAYPMLARAAGATPVMVPLGESAEHDLDAMAAAVNDRTRLILICNPNNPTGTVISNTELQRFLNRVPSDIVVVIDEAYEHFNTQEDAPQGISLFRKHPNVAVAHTFSKAYGLAGIRVGYAVAPAALADAMRKVSLPFAVTSLAQHAAVASLAAEDELQERVDDLVDERERVFAALEAAGWQLPRSQANFLWLPLGEDTAAAAALLEDFGLVVRAFPGEGMRASIAESEANDLLIIAMATLAEQGLTGPSGTFRRPAPTPTR